MILFYIYIYIYHMSNHIFNKKLRLYICTLICFILSTFVIFHSIRVLLNNVLSYITFIYIYIYIYIYICIHVYSYILYVCVGVYRETFADLTARCTGEEIRVCLASLCKRIDEWHFYTSQNKEMHESINLLQNVSVMLSLNR